jgi:hypothetical protein
MERVARLEMNKLRLSMTHSRRTTEIRASQAPVMRDSALQDRTPPQRESRSHVARIARSSPRDLTPSDVLHLQSASGNHATASLLGPPAPFTHPVKAPAPAIRLDRWGASEHEMLGDKGSGNRDVELAPGYTLSFGEVVALAGDHFANIEQMRQFAANTKGGPGSRAEIEYALEWKLHKRGRKWDEKAKGAQEARYYTLAGRNWSHFLNPSTVDIEKDPAQRAGDPKKYINAKYTTAPEGGSQAYRMNHVWAIKEAVESAQEKGSLDKALAVEAFAAHFLTDAFSAGHVRTPRSEAKAYWDAKVPMFVYNLTGYIAEAVAKNLGTWQKGVIPTDVTMRHDFPFGLGAHAQVQELLQAKRFTFGDVVGLALHDWDNATGLMATSHGHDVHLLGDDRLVAVGNDAMPHAIKAVREGVAEIDQAFALGHKGQDLNTVLDSLLNNGLFAAETWLPKPKSDAEQTADSKSIKWKFPSVFSLLADERFGAAVKLFLKEKAGVLKEVAAGLAPDPRKAFETGVLSKLESDPIGTLMAVVQWVPNQTKSKPWEAENAATYYHEAEKIKGGVASLTLQQRLRLMNKLLFHKYGGQRELLGLLTSTSDADARKLIRLLGWDRLHAKIDDKAMPFKDRYPEKKFGPSSSPL